MDCDKALLVAPPPDAFMEYHYFTIPPLVNEDPSTFVSKRTEISRGRAKREQFMLCGLISALNDALRHYKQQACNGTANLEETWSVYDDPKDY